MPSGENSLIKPALLDFYLSCFYGFRIDSAYTMQSAAPARQANPFRTQHHIHVLIVTPAFWGSKPQARDRIMHIHRRANKPSISLSEPHK